MAANYTAEVLGSRALRRMVDFDPDATTAVVATLNPAASEKCLEIGQYKRFIFGIFRSVGTGSLTAARIIAAGNAAGTTSPTTVIAHAIGSAPNAVGDTIWMECDVEQVREVLASATHVGVEITQVTAGDECVVYVEAAEPMFPRTGLTADYIS